MYRLAFGHVPNSLCTRSGLLAGLFEFPAIDLPPEDSSLKAAARSSRLDKLVRSLIDVSDCPLRAAGDTSDGALVSRAALPTVTQVYSHMTRTYLAERVVISSATLPRLRPAKRDAADVEPVQSRAGSAKWVPASAVATANVGGAVGKIWEERVHVVKGGKAGTTAKKPASKARNGVAAAAARRLPEKGQVSLNGFFTRKTSASTAAQASPSSAVGGSRSSRSPSIKSAFASAAQDEDDDLVIVEAVSSTTVQAIAESDKPRQASAGGPAKVYKKRRIASDSEDE